MSKKINPPEKQELFDLYSKKGSTISSLARHYNTSNPTIRKWLIEYSIDRKSHKQASKEANNRKRNNPPDKDILEKYYKTNSIKNLENIFGVSQETIYLWLNSYNIKIKNISEAISQAKEKNFLEHLPSLNEISNAYQKCGSKKALEKYFKCSRTTIDRWFKYYDIKTKPSFKSSQEYQLFTWLLSIDPKGNWISQDRSLINPYEIDMISYERKIAIEYCGLYWHCESFGKSRNYHYEKYRLCQEKNFQLITIFELDDLRKIKSLIANKLNLSKKLYARNTLIKIVDSKIANDFHEKYHLHGTIGSKISYGAYFNGDLISVMSFGKNRFDKKYEWEITRFTNKSYILNIGGASKIFKNFLKDIKPQNVKTYADLRFGNGNVYDHMGFKNISISSPNYWYFKKNYPTKLLSRVQFQKHKLPSKLNIFDDNLSEYENMKLNGYDRIWDCGNSVWIFEN